MMRAAEWIAEKLRGLDFEEVRIIPTDRHPVVFGQWLNAGDDAPTLLFYGHYDVQPSDPDDEWLSDPFEPEIRGDDIFGRGTSDMKAQLIAHLAALTSMIRTTSLPLNVKYMIEGEEEIGSPSLEKFMRSHKDLLSSDLCLNGDAGRSDDFRPHRDPGFRRYSDAGGCYRQAGLFAGNLRPRGQPHGYRTGHGPAR